MQSSSGPPDFDEIDWSKFDFSRWHLDGLTLDAATEAVAGLAQKLFTSEEWQQHFQATLPNLQKQALGFFKEHSRQLHEAKTAIAQNFDTRIQAARKRSEEVRKVIEQSNAPPLLSANPETFQLAVRVTAKDGLLGLPGVVVQVADPQKPKTPLVQAVSDRDGNAILTVPPELAKELDKKDVAFQVADANGKPLLKSPATICVRLNETDTKIVTLADSAAIDPHKKTATSVRSEREILIRNVDAQVEALNQERKARLDDFDRRIRDNEAILAEFEPVSGTAPAAEEPEEQKPGDSRKRGKKT